MKRKLVLLVIIGTVVLGGILYIYMPELLLSSQSSSNCSAPTINCKSVSTAFPSSLPSSHLQVASNFGLSQQAEAGPITADPQQVNLESVVTQKYAILFSFLQMSAQAQRPMHELLLKREQILSSQFYDSRSNEAEVAANLRKRDEEVAGIDREIEALLPEGDRKKYGLLKDSTYEQDQLKGFYELAGAENNLPLENKEKLLLAKLEQKQFTTNLLNSTGENIKNAASGTRPYLIEKMHQSMIDEKETYLNTAKLLLNEEQFNLLRDYEQQIFDERWRDISTSLSPE